MIYSENVPVFLIKPLQRFLGIILNTSFFSILHYLKKHYFSLKKKFYSPQQLHPKFLPLYFYLTSKILLHKEQPIKT